MKRVGRFVQSLLNDWARQAGEVSGVLQRQRRFDAPTLAQTFVLAHLDDPCASHDDLAGFAALCGVEVSPQTFDQRVAELTGRTATHQMVRLWSRLIAAVLTHWVLITAVWGNAKLSLAKATQALQGLSGLIVLHQHEIEPLTQALTSLSKKAPLRRTPQQTVDRQYLRTTRGSRLARMGHPLT